MKKQYKKARAGTPTTDHLPCRTLACEQVFLYLNVNSLHNKSAPKSSLFFPDLQSFTCVVQNTQYVAIFFQQATISCAQ